VRIRLEHMEELLKEVVGELKDTVSISPEMYNEFFFPYYLEAAQQFGLVSYGCCEPVHN
jgi:hypothetical protein